MPPRVLPDVIASAREQGPDFDDAYQYATAQKFGLTIVSFDAHFDATALGRKTPASFP